jgi:hypothetical protein
MAQMKLLKDKWRYAKQPLVAGDVFDVKDIHVPLLAAAKIAEPADAKAKALAQGKKKTVARKPAAKAATTQSATGKKRGRPPGKTGTYARRDMRAK